MRARNTPPWWTDRPMASLVKRIAQAQQPRGTVPASWVAGLEACVRSGYLYEPESILPLASPSLLRELAPSAMKEHGDRGFLGFGVFVAWCCDLRRGAVADFPEVDTRADQDLEVTILARCLDLAMTAPSWSRSGSNGARLRDIGAGARRSAGDGRCFTGSPCSRCSFSPTRPESRTRNAHHWAHDAPGRARHRPHPDTPRGTRR